MQRGFVMNNSENMAEGSDSAAQDIFQWSKRIKSEVWCILGLFRRPRGSYLKTDKLSAESTERKLPLKGATRQICSATFVTATTCNNSASKLPLTFSLMLDVETVSGEIAILNLFNSPIAGQ